MNSEKNHYATLCVAPSAEDIVIRAAYRALAQRYHPDRARGSMEHARRMTEINEAYAVLSDPEKRRQYDLARERGPQPSNAYATEQTDDMSPGDDPWVSPQQGAIVWTLLFFSWFLSLIVIVMIIGTLAIAGMPFPSLSRPVWMIALTVLSATITWGIYKLFSHVRS